MPSGFGSALRIDTGFQQGEPPTHSLLRLLRTSAVHDRYFIGGTAKLHTGDIGTLNSVAAKASSTLILATLPLQPSAARSALRREPRE